MSEWTVDGEPMTDRARLQRGLATCQKKDTEQTALGWICLGAVGMLIWLPFEDLRLLWISVPAGLIFLAMAAYGFACAEEARSVSREVIQALRDLP